jgi:NADH-quinone oxidoreductase subunit F
MADKERDHPWTPAKKEGAKAKKVAVIGSGPAGLTAGLRLAQLGYPVTIFEKLPVAGGWMAVGIPEYRLPRDILNLEIENIKRAGVEIRLNQEMGKDFAIEDLMNGQGYSAVVLAIGAHKSRKLGIPNEELPGVYHGTVFLKDVALGKAPDIKGKRVAVVGGGAVAVDSARTALRLGASKVHLVYRRTRAEMPAWEEEVHAAGQEGIVFHFLTNPVEVVGTDRVTGVKLQAQKLGEFDAGGRRKPMPMEGSEYVLDVDLVIPAIGQAMQVECLGSCGDLSFERAGTITVGPNLATTREGVFAAGDAALGPATVVEAVNQGNRVAVAVDNYLKGQKVERPKFVTGYHEIPQVYNIDEFAEAKRPVMPEMPLEERVACFDEVELGFDDNVAREECKRCLRCDLEWLDSMGLLSEAAKATKEEAA